MGRRITNVLPYFYIYDFIDYLIKRGWSCTSPDYEYYEVFKVRKGKEFIALYEIGHSEYLGIEDKDTGILHRFMSEGGLLHKKVTGEFLDITNHIHMGLSNKVCEDRSYFCTIKGVFMDEGDVARKKCYHKYTYNGQVEYVCKRMIVLKDRIIQRERGNKEPNAECIKNYNGEGLKSSDKATEQDES